MVHSLLTLGTPHHSIEQYPLGRVPEKLAIDPSAPPEVAGSSLKFANHYYPRGDCFQGVRVVSSTIADVHDFACAAFLFFFRAREPTALECPAGVRLRKRYQRAPAVEEGQRAGGRRRAGWAVCRAARQRTRSLFRLRGVSIWVWPRRRGRGWSDPNLHCPSGKFGSLFTAPLLPCQPASCRCCGAVQTCRKARRIWCWKESGTTLGGGRESSGTALLRSLRAGKSTSPGGMLWNRTQCPL